MLHALLCVIAATYSPTAQQIRDNWILDGEVQMTVRGERELALTLPPDAQFTLWTPKAFEGPLEVSFEAFVPEDKTKLLLMLYGHGLGDKAIWTWKRTASYEDYNSGPMEVYTVAFNRGVDTATRPGDEFANVRRIGGSRFDFYTTENRKAKNRAEQETMWERWNTLSFLGGAREPVSGKGRWIAYRVVCNPPHLRMTCDGVEFVELVDHLPAPLRKGAVGFRCMSRGKSFTLRNVVIKGYVAAEMKR